MSRLGYSPAQFLTSRMPSVSSLLICKVARGAYSMLEARKKQKRKEYFNSRSKSVPKLSMRDSAPSQVWSYMEPGSGDQ